MAENSIPEEVEYPEEYNLDDYNIKELKQHLKLFFQNYPGSLTKQILKALEDYYAHPNIQDLEARKAQSDRKVIGRACVNYMANNSNQPPLVCVLLMSYQLLEGLEQHMEPEDVKRQIVLLSIDVNNYLVSQVSFNNVRSLLEKHNLKLCISSLHNLGHWNLHPEKKEAAGKTYGANELNQLLIKFFTQLDEETHTKALSSLGECYEKTTVIDKKQEEAVLQSGGCIEYVSKKVKVPMILANMVEIHQIYRVLGARVEKEEDPLVLATASQLMISISDSVKRESMKKYIAGKEKDTQVTYNEIMKFHQERGA